jgi:Ring finger domain
MSCTPRLSNSYQPNENKDIILPPPVLLTCQKYCKVRTSEIKLEGRSKFASKVLNFQASTGSSSSCPKLQQLKSPTNRRLLESLEVQSFMAGGIDTDDICAICLESLRDELVSSGLCRHIHHTRCLAGWIAKDCSCPVCRETFLCRTDKKNWQEKSR